MIRLAILQALAGPDYVVSVRGEGGRFAPTEDFAVLGRAIILAVAAVAIIGALLAAGAR